MTQEAEITLERIEAAVSWAAGEGRIEAMAKAAYEFDWPNDKWERLGPGYHQDRYKGMIRAALKAVEA